MRKIIFIAMLITIATKVYSNVNKVVVSDFSQMGLSGWDVKSFDGKTDYELVGEVGSEYLRASADASASALFKKIKINLNDTPYLNWSWRVDQALMPINELTKQGDDYAARIYVIVKRGLSPWKTNALNYVWSSNAMPLDSWPNAYTDKAIMIPLRDQLDDNVWVFEKVNIKDDFKKYFGIDVEKVDAVAIMTDTDNSRSQAVASYGDIFFSAH
jgi:hypothetical protein